MTTNSPNPVDGDVQALKFRAEAAEAKLNLCRSVLYSLAFVARRILPDYDEHPEIQRADEILDDDSFINTPPAQLLRPVELPKPIQQTEVSDYGLESRDGYGLHWGSVETLKLVAESLRQQGYEVKS